MTRERILRLARQAFAELGYDAATNKNLALEAGLTTGALYHYFESKFDIYLAVHEDVQDVVYDRFNQVVRDAPSFLGAIEAVLEAAHELNNDDPTLASFLGSLRIDMQRHPELATAFKPFAKVRRQFFDELVEVGIRTGEIDADDRPRVNAFLRAMLIGLTDAVSYDRQLHRDAIDGLKALLEGKLIRST